jgi:membrane protein
VLFAAGRAAIGLYIGNSDLGSTYGSAGAIMILLLWIYYSSVILFLGAEFTQVYAGRRGGGIEATGKKVERGDKSK